MNDPQPMELNGQVPNAPTPAPKLDDEGVLGRGAIYRDVAGNEHGCIICDHDGEGKVKAFVWERLTGQIMTVTAPLVAGPHIDARQQPPGGMAAGQTTDQLERAAVVYEVRPRLRLGADVLFRGTVGKLANPKLPPNVIGVLPGKIVGIGDNGMLQVMLFPAVGAILVAQGVRPVVADVEQPGTCWIEP